MRSQLDNSSRQKILLEVQTLLRKALEVYPKRVAELNYASLENLATVENWQLDREIEFTLHELELLIDSNLEAVDRHEYMFGITYFRSLIKNPRKPKGLPRWTLKI